MQKLPFKLEREFVSKLNGKYLFLKYVTFFCLFVSVISFLVMNFIVVNSFFLSLLFIVFFILFFVFNYARHSKKMLILEIHNVLTYNNGIRIGKNQIDLKDDDGKEMIVVVSSEHVAEKIPDFLFHDIESGKLYPIREENEPLELVESSRLKFFAFRNYDVNKKSSLVSAFVYNGLYTHVDFRGMLVPVHVIDYKKEDNFERDERIIKNDGDFIPLR